MLPLSLLNAAQGQPMMVELKSGETLNGHLVSCDTWMNLTLKEVVQTSPDGENFMKLPEMYVRGNIIKYLRVPEEILDVIKEDRQNRNMERNKERFNRNNNGGYRNRQGGNQRQGQYRNNNNNNNYNDRQRRRGGDRDNNGGDHKRY